MDTTEIMDRPERAKERPQLIYADELYAVTTFVDGVERYVMMAGVPLTAQSQDGFRTLAETASRLATDFGKEFTIKGYRSNIVKGRFPVPDKIIHLDTAG